MSHSQEFIDRVFLEIARSFAKLSHCAKTQVAAIAVKDGRVIATGINGTPPGHENCDQVHVGDFDHAAHRIWADHNEIHGEQNMINFAARFGIELDGCTVYSTLEPCSQCTKNMTTAGVVRIVYETQYDRWTAEERERTIEFLKKAGLTIVYVPRSNDVPETNGNGESEVRPLESEPPHSLCGLSGNWPVGS